MTQPTTAELHEALLEQIEDEGQAYTVVAQGDTRLAQLQAAYLDAKADADDAAKKLKAITDGIKLELSQAAPDETRIELAAQGDAPGLRLAYSERWTLDSKRMKSEDPETYVRYARKGGAWTLTKVRA
jgi:hypothetical protein